MKDGQNCCEAVLLAASALWDLDLAGDTLAAAKFFQLGMGSGCTCGALVGMVMVCGILEQKKPHPLGDKLPGHIYERFKKEFGSTCCRVIRKQRPVWRKMDKTACIELTSRAAAMLAEEWEEILDGEGRNLCHYSDT